MGAPKKAVHAGPASSGPTKANYWAERGETSKVRPGHPGFVFQMLTAKDVASTACQLRPVGSTEPISYEFRQGSIRL